MATKVVMAQLSPTMEEGRLLEWKVVEGAAVSKGDVVAEIETDKANMEVEAMGGGVLRKILVAVGQTVPVGTLIGVIADPDEDIQELLAGAAAPAAPAPAATDDARPSADAVEVAADGPASEQAPIESAAQALPDDGRIKASPVARKIAHERGLDLRTIVGSGPGGRIVKADVEAAPVGAASPAPYPAAPGAPAPASPAATVTSSPPPAAEPLPAAALPPTAVESPGPNRLEERVEEASQMRKAIARRLVESIGPVPHFFLTTEIDMGRALELRSELNNRQTDGKIGVNDLLLKAAAEALVRNQAVNASWEETAIRYHGRVDLGIAVAVDGGLITPVLRNADGKGLRRISAEARDLIERGRNRTLIPEEYQGATFSVSNLGMYQIEQFTAVINPPEAAILAVGRTLEKAVVIDGQVAVRQRMRVTMSCDHRVVDGATGAAFLETFKAMLENPLEMLL